MSFKIYTANVNKLSVSSPAVIVSSFIIAIIFSLISLNNWSSYNPLWVVLVLTYWHVRLDIKDNYNNLYYAFLLGIICDLIFNRAIGVSAISYLTISYCLSILKPKIYFYTLIQMTFLVLMLVLINQFVFLFYNIYLGSLNNVTKVMFFAPVITSLLVWPLICLVLDRFLLNSK